jgi:Fe-S cluster assembly protein SufD
MLEDKILYSFFSNKKFFKKNTNKFIYKLRCKAINFFKKKRFPSYYEKKWEHYNLNFLKKEFFLYKKKSYVKNFSKLEKISSLRLVFVNGIYNSFLSENSHKKKYISILSHFFLSKKNFKYIKKKYCKIMNKYDSLSALNTAFAQDGAFIFIPKGTLIKKTIEILYIYTDIGMTSKSIMIFPRNLIIIEKKGNVKIVERHQYTKKESIFSNSVTEIFCGEESKVEYYKIQNNSSENYLIDNTFLIQKKKSECLVNTFSFNGKFIRNNLNIFNKGKKIKSYITGLTIVNKKEIVDHHTLINHKKSFCKSYQFYKGIFSGSTKGIFNGKIIVNNNIYNINAYQKNKNIILSDKACVYTKPELEIFSNNVKCSHGCTVGKFNISDLFYLRSRGLSEKQAINLLTFAFAKEIILFISISKLKKIILKIINKKLKYNFKL